MKEKKKKKRGWLEAIRESMTKTGGCCGPGETCCGPTEGKDKEEDKDKAAKESESQKDSKQ